MGLTIVSGFIGFLTRSVKGKACPLVFRRSPRLQGIGFILVPLLMASGLMIAPSHAADVCPKFEFIGGRGSGESPRPSDASPDYSQVNQYGMGSLLFSVYDQLAGLVGTDQLAAYGVHYPAVALTDSLGDYIN